MTCSKLSIRRVSCQFMSKLKNDVFEIGWTCSIIFIIFWAIANERERERENTSILLFCTRNRKNHEPQIIILSVLLVCVGGICCCCNSSGQNIYKSFNIADMHSNNMRSNVDTVIWRFHFAPHHCALTVPVSSFIFPCILSAMSFSSHRRSRSRHQHQHEHHSIASIPHFIASDHIPDAYAVLKRHSARRG